MKIRLTEWAAQHYRPAPSAYTLRLWTRAGEIFPAPEMIGHAYMVDEDARRVTAPVRQRVALVDRLKVAAC